MRILNACSLKQNFILLGIQGEMMTPENSIQNILLRRAQFAMQEKKSSISWSLDPKRRKITSAVPLFNYPPVLNTDAYYAIIIPKTAQESLCGYNHIPATVTGAPICAYSA